jgi:ABC-type hemin transport system ATPase subunit
MDGATPLLEVSGATVRFGAETALDGVDFRLFPGEVHSVMGENGAGKSTLIKAITGALPMDAGMLRIDYAAGIKMVATVSTGDSRSTRAVLRYVGATFRRAFIVKIAMGNIPWITPNATLADRVSPKIRRMIG